MQYRKNVFSIVGTIYFPIQQKRRKESLGLAKKGAQLLINTGELSQFHHVKQAALEDSDIDSDSDSDVTTGEVSGVDFW